MILSKIKIHKQDQSIQSLGLKRALIGMHNYNENKNSDHPPADGSRFPAYQLSQTPDALIR